MHELICTATTAAMCSWLAQLAPPPLVGFSHTLRRGVCVGCRGDCEHSCCRGYCSGCCGCNYGNTNGGDDDCDVNSGDNYSNRTNHPVCDGDDCQPAAAATTTSVVATTIAGMPAAPHDHWRHY